MPKSGGSDDKTMRPVRAERPAPQARPIQWSDSTSGAKVDAMSPGAPKRADSVKSAATSKTAEDVVRAAENPPGSDGRMQRY
jgi:hypothetical protein